MEVTPVSVGDVLFGGARLCLIAGPCVMESVSLCEEVAGTVRELCGELGIGFVFKSSFDKANRSSVSAIRGPGMDEGLEILAHIRKTFGVPVLTDIHDLAQAAPVAEVVDILQIPAFLCRQTDLLLAAAATGRVVNVKKGQFMAPWDMKNVVAKLQEGGAAGILLTERGVSFGYNNLVTDFRALPLMRELGVPVIFDGTHSVQQPGGLGSATGGDRRFVPPLCRAAVAVGVDGLFIETHPDPDRAPSDGPNMLRLTDLPAVLETCIAIRV
ncbi:MAG: 3-deoxy-8-phosphooctulonate synthase, partial [Armatimonadota bacterium]|nr:3-deoxy-8-phosphooctulonate synthase [Armatimonadota bacterium]